MHLISSLQISFEGEDASPEMVRTPTLNKLQFHPVFRKKCNKFQGKPKKFAQQKTVSETLSLKLPLVSWSGNSQAWKPRPKPRCQAQSLLLQSSVTRRWARQRSCEWCLEPKYRSWDFEKKLAVSSGVRNIQRLSNKLSKSNYVKSWETCFFRIWRSGTTQMGKRYTSKSLMVPLVAKILLHDHIKNSSSL